MRSKADSESLELILNKLTSDEAAFISSLIDKDPLTGVYNRRKFDRDIELVISMSERTKKGTSLLILDIDLFKQYNDRYGHQQGDRVLTQLSETIEKSLRHYDRIHVYRYGGEEFVLLIPEISSKDALRIGERLRENIKKACGITVSIGISHYKENSHNLESMIFNADKAMYQAKRTGRNKVVLYDATDRL
jgi:diguanylate cyclase (GGDEF)-like protein